MNIKERIKEGLSRLPEGLKEYSALGVVPIVDNITNQVLSKSKEYVPNMSTPIDKMFIEGLYLIAIPLAFYGIHELSKKNKDKP